MIKLVLQVLTENKDLGNMEYYTPYLTKKVELDDKVAGMILTKNKRSILFSTVQDALSRLILTVDGRPVLFGYQAHSDTYVPVSTSNDNIGVLAALVKRELFYKHGLTNDDHEVRVINSMLDDIYYQPPIDFKIQENIEINVSNPNSIDIKDFFLHEDEVYCCEPFEFNVGKVNGDKFLIELIKTELKARREGRQPRKIEAVMSHKDDDTKRVPISVKDGKILLEDKFGLSKEEREMIMNLRKHHIDPLNEKQLLEWKVSCDLADMFHEAFKGTKKPEASPKVEGERLSGSEALSKLEAFLKGL